MIQYSLLKTQPLFEITCICVGKTMVTNIKSNTDKLVMKIFSPVRSDLVFITAMMVIRFPRTPNMMIGIPTAKAVTRTKSEYFLEFLITRKIIGCVHCRQRGCRKIHSFQSWLPNSINSSQVTIKLTLQIKIEDIHIASYALQFIGTNIQLDHVIIYSIRKIEPFELQSH